MPTYVLGPTTSDLSGGADFNRYLDPSPSSQGSISVPVAKSATEISYAFTRAGVPNNIHWETGSITVESYISTASTYIYLSIQIHRINSAGVVQQSSTVTAEQQCTAGLKTFAVASVDWFAGAASDRIRVDYRFRNSSSSARTVGIRTGTVDCEVITVINSYSNSSVAIPSIALAVFSPSAAILSSVSFDCLSSVGFVASVDINSSVSVVSVSSLFPSPQLVCNPIVSLISECVFSAHPIQISPSSVSISSSSQFSCSPGVVVSSSVLFSLSSLMLPSSELVTNVSAAVVSESLFSASPIQLLLGSASLLSGSQHNWSPVILVLPSASFGSSSSLSLFSELVNYASVYFVSLSEFGAVADAVLHLSVNISDYSFVVVVPTLVGSTPGVHIVMCSVVEFVPSLYSDIVIAPTVIIRKFNRKDHKKFKLSRHTFYPYIY